MSEDISTPAQEVVEASAGTETVETTEETSTRHKSYQGRDRVGEALDRAKNGPITTPETMSVETLGEVESLDEGGHKGIDYNRVINNLPDEAQKLLSNIRADYTRKTQELASQRKELESMRDSLVKGSESEQIQQLAQEEYTELDPYDTQSFEKRIQQEVAKRLQELMTPMREEQAVAKKRAQLQQFKNEHPDLMDYREPITKLLQENATMSLENAYFIVKGKAAGEENKKLKEELQQRTNRMREVGLKLSSGGVREAKGNKIPKHLTKAHEIYAYLKAQKG